MSRSHEASRGAVFSEYGAGGGGGDGGSGVGFALPGVKRTEGGVGHCAFGQVGRGGQWAQELIGSLGFDAERR